MTTFLTGCRTENLPFEPFNDDIYAYTYTPKYGIAVGLKGAYVTYGVYPTVGKKIKAGTAVSPFKLWIFPIRSVLNQHPELASEEAIKAADEQEKKLKTNRM